MSNYKIECLTYEMLEDLVDHLMWNSIYLLCYNLWIYSTSYSINRGF